MGTEDALHIRRGQRQLRLRRQPLRRHRQVSQARAGTMCPSYMATQEEPYSTRGRARLLFEMLEGNPMETAGRTKPSRRRSTCACRAKAARASARSTSIWRRTRPSFSRTITRGAAPARGICVRPHVLVGAASLARPGWRTALTQTPGLRDVAKALVGDRAPAHDSTLRAADVSSWFARRPRRTPASRA